ncbi:MAG: glycosyltransferase [Actinomycetota bacterium]|nr:glycosyltransferase [Actinomycetota bacterium]
MSVVVPFRGDQTAAGRLTASLRKLELREGDEVIIADNSDASMVVTSSSIRAVSATGECSSYHARNVAATHAKGDWLLFTDADCVPDSNVVDAYLTDPVPDGVGALAGNVVSDPLQRHFLARYATDRGFLDQEGGLHTAEDAAATANLMVRRTAFEEVGGFVEGIRSGGDVDFCRRLGAAGWRIERRPAARVVHLHRESLRDLLGSIARYASGASWLDERYPGSAPEWPLASGLMDCGRDIGADLARRRFEQAAFRGIDALGLVAHTIGYRRSNAAG